MATVTFPRRITSNPCVVTVSGMPSWAPSAGYFRNISLANPSEADPDPTNVAIYKGVNGFESIWNAWNDGAFGAEYGTYGSMFFFGGGHFAYAGNEVVCYDLATRHSTRLSEPDLYSATAPVDVNSNLTSVDQYGSFPEGRPFPAHTNLATAYVPSDAGGGAQGSFVFVHHDNTGVDIRHHVLWRFDLASRLWSQNCILPEAGSGPLSNLGSLTYDAKRKVLWAAFSNYPGAISGYLYHINVATGVATQVQVNGGTIRYGYYGALTYCASRDCLVGPTQLALAPSYQKGLLVVDLNAWSLGGSAPATNFTTWTGTPCPSLWADPNASQVGGNDYLNNGNCDKLAYCSLDGNLYMIDRFSSVCTLYRLTPPAALLSDNWTWSSETIASQVGDAYALRDLPYTIPSDKGLGGRFSYAPAIKSFVLSDSSLKAAQAIRPAAFT